MINDSHFKLLGFKVKDSVTGFKGVVTTLSFDLYGCIQAIVTPTIDGTGKTQDGQWFDITRLEVKSKKPVMRLPNFNDGYVSEGNKGCAEKMLP